MTGGESLNAEGSVVTLAFSPDGKMLVAGTHVLSGARFWEGDLVVWVIGSGNPARRFQQKQWVNSVAVSPDGNTLAIGCGIANYSEVPDLLGYSEKQGEMRLLNLKTFAVVGTHETEGGVFGVAFSPDGRLLAVASGGKSGESDKVELLRATDLKPQKALQGPRGFARLDRFIFTSAMAFHPTCQMLAIGEGAMLMPPTKPSVRIWKFEEGTDFAVEVGPRAVTSLCFVSGGDSLALTDGIVSLWGAECIERSGTWGSR